MRTSDRPTWTGPRPAFGSLIVVVLTVGAVVLGPADPAPARGASVDAPTASAPGFVPVGPRRLVDTRIAQGGTQGPLAAGTELQVPVPADVPASAKSVALTVTSDQYAEAGFVTAYPCGLPRPLASLLNPRPDEPRSNQLVVGIGASKKVCLYTLLRADLIVDITGWFVDGGAPFHPIDPYRAFDSRFGPRPDDDKGKPAAGQTVKIPLAGRPHVPAGATAVAANITVTNSEGDGYVTAFPCGSPVPPSSTGNVPDGGTRASFTLVGLGSGALCVYVKQSADLVVDITGWFGSGAGDAMLPATPRRLLDTRTDAGGELDPGRQRVVRLGLPTGTTSAALNVTAVDGEEPGWIALSPCTAQAETSTVNFEPGMAIANLVTVPVAGSDSLCIRTNVRGHVVIDIAASSKLGPVAVFAIDGLRPSFRPDILDYTLRCAAGDNSIPVTLAAEPGATVSANGGAAGPSFDAPVTLKPGKAMTATFADASGSTTYRIRCLPPDFPSFTTYRPGLNVASHYLMTPGTPAGQTGAYTVIVDREGVPVWWYKNPTQIADARVEAGPTIAWASSAGSFGSDPSSEYTFHALNGSVTSHAKVVGQNTDFHDMAMLPNGNRIMMSYPVRDHVDLTALGLGTDRLVLDGLLQELTPAGAVVWQWRSQDHIQPAETTRPNVTRLPDNRMAVDLVHLNAVEDDGTSLIVSARHIDAVFRIDRTTGKIVWKLGGTAPSEAGAKDLAFVNDPLASFGGQHDARILSDGTMTLYDNRTNVGSPRAVRYQLDLTANTATLLEEVTDPDITASGFQGSARRTSSGTWVVAWGGTKFVEELSAAGAPLFSFSFDSVLTYRAVPLEGQLTRAALAAGMDAQVP